MALTTVNPGRPAISPAPRRTRADCDASLPERRVLDQHLVGVARAQVHVRLHRALGDDEVADLWAANKMKTEPPREEDYFNAAGERVRGVQGFERPAILKNLLPDLAQQEGFIEQFLDEARVAATLNHPNVVSIYEVGLWDGTYFIAMEYIQGRNVSQLIKAALRSQQPMPPLVAARQRLSQGWSQARAQTDGNGLARRITR
jgi:serine/threonine protein kinase